MKTSTKRKAKMVEYTVKIRIKTERLEWFFDLSDRLGLTRDQSRHRDAGK